MAIEFVCPTCQHTLRVGDESADKVVRCGSCLTTLRVPAAVARPAPPPDVPEAEVVDDAESPAPRKPSPVVVGSVKGVAARPASAPRPRPAAKPALGGRAVILLVLLLVVVFVGAIGGAAYYLLTPKWRPHESLAGGFKVEFPAAPRDDVANDPAARRAGVNSAVEGTLLRLRSEEYVVMYIEIPAQRRQTMTDDGLFQDAIDNVKLEQPDVHFTRNDPVVVSGFPARELECTSHKLGSAILRIVLAETRAYVVIAAGRGANANNERFRRFIDSFEVTDPRLFAQAKARKDAADRVEENRRRAREDAERRQKELDDRMAAERKQVEDNLRAEEKRRADAEQARKDEDARIRRDAEAFRTAKWTGPAIPDPNTIPTLKLYLPFDGGTGREATVMPSGSTVPTAEYATTGAGVRGDALYLARDTRGFTILADKVPDALKRNRSVTLTAWVKVRGPAYVVPLVTDMNRGRQTGLRLGSDTKQFGVWTDSQQTLAPELNAPWTPDEGWHHLALVRYLTGDDSFVYTLYLDGTEVKTGSSFGYMSKTLFEIRGLRIGGAGEQEFIRPPSEAQVRRELPIAAVDELCVFDDALSPRAVAYLAGKVKDVPRDQALLPPPPTPAPAPRPVSPRYAGRPAAAPSEMAGLRYHLPCDSLDGGQLTESVGKTAVGAFASTPRLVDGVRGRAVRISADPARPKDRVVGLSLDAAKLRVDPSKPFTLTFWARRVESPADRSRPPEKIIFVAAQSDPKAVGRRSFALSHVGGTAMARLSEASIQSERGTGGWASVTHKEVAPFGWNHYALTRDEKNRLWLWVNGETTWVDPRPAPVWPLWYDDFGVGVAGHDESGLGVISPGPAVLDLDDFALFDRALTEDEIVKLAGSPNVAGRPAAASADPAPSVHIAVIKPAAKYAGGAVPPATDFKGLTYYLPFNDLSNASVKEVVSGKSVGVNKWSEPTDGPRGKAVRVVAGSRGAGSAAVSLSHAPPEVGFGKPFTMAVWVRAADGSAASQEFDVIRSRDRTGNRLTMFSLRRQLNEYAVLTGEGFATIEQSLKPTAVQQFPKGEWTHLAVTRGEKGEVRWAINGQVCGRTPPPFVHALKFEDLSLGWGQAGPFVLDIAEFCVFDRALTEDELKKLGAKK